MGSKTDACEIDILKLLTGQATSIFTTTPFTPYLALYTVNPTDSTAGTECSGGSYARVAVNGKWGTPAAGSVSNNAIITMPTATGSWGTVTGFGIFSALAGTLLIWGALGTSKPVANGDTPAFAVGQLVLTED